jgi:hypothetical protein
MSLNQNDAIENRFRSLIFKGIVYSLAASLGRERRLTSLLGSNRDLSSSDGINLGGGHASLLGHVVSREVTESGVESLREKLVIAGLEGVGSSLGKNLLEVILNDDLGSVVDLAHVAHVRKTKF